MRNAAPTIHFAFDPDAVQWCDIERLDESDIAKSPHRFVGGRNSWVAQTFVRLRRHLEARGWKASAGPLGAPGAITIVHRDDANDFHGGGHASLLVVVRADRAPVAACDYAIVQNGIAPRPHERFIPLWPQPGLTPRDPRRGTTIARIAYHGRVGAAPAWFYDESLRRSLARRGIRFDVREAFWEDYETVDIAIAARDEVPGVLATKPATKVYNAWLAGVPVLAAPEPAYRELRRSSLDFLEIRDATDVLRCIDQLRSSPELYEAMVANGLVRGNEFTVQAIRRRWLLLLEREIVPAFCAAGDRLRSRRLWFMGAMARQKIASRLFRMRIAIERSRLKTASAVAAPPSAASSFPYGRFAQDHRNETLLRRSSRSPMLAAIRGPHEADTKLTERNRP
jgi:hypothetical protein